MFIFGQLN